MTTPAGISIDIDHVLGLPAEPPSPTTDAVTHALDTATPTLAVSGPTAMVCRDMLDAPTRAAVEAKAKQLFPVLYADDNALGVFGNESVEAINALVSNMLGDLGRAADVPELTALTNELDDKLRGFTNKYGSDQAIAEARASYTNLRGKIMDFFNKFRNMLEMLLKDAKGLEKYLDSLKADLIEKQGELRLNVDPVGGVVLLSPPLRFSTDDDLDQWAQSGRPVVAVVPALDDYLQPDEATERFSRIPQAQVIGVPEAKHLWVGEKYVRIALDEVVRAVVPSAAPLPVDFDGPMERWSDL